MTEKQIEGLIKTSVQAHFADNNLGKMINFNDEVLFLFFSKKWDKKLRRYKSCTIASSDKTIILNCSVADIYPVGILTDDPVFRFPYIGMEMPGAKKLMPNFSKIPSKNSESTFRIDDFEEDNSMLGKTGHFTLSFI